MVNNSTIKNPIFFKDFYKTDHISQYPKGTTKIISNLTPRKSLLPGINHAVSFGLTYFIKEYLEYRFNTFFFNRPHDEVMSEYKEVMKQILGQVKEWEHISRLHKLGYLPIEIKALPELSIVSCGVPTLVIFNTHDDFFWVTNMLETILSCVLWGASTSATIAREYRLLLDKYAAETSSIPEFVDWQAHDFSFRGMNGLDAAMLSGAAHLQYFKGTDCIPAVLFSNKYYGKELNCGGSINATEHSVMSAGGKENEIETYRRLINEVYPVGIVSIVSDTWDLWNVVDNFLPLLKDDVMKRDGKLVIRPDSGKPEDIICGTIESITHRESGEKTDFSTKGLIEKLWDIFGGTINSKGYKELDPHIGAIYGDSITLSRAKEICERLKQKGFASTNIVFGIGSFTYQYNTRDTLGWAMKATYAIINGEGVPITKDPKTDNGTKKSHSGLLKVIKKNNQYIVLQNVSEEEFYSPTNELKTVYNGQSLNFLRKNI